MSNYINKTLFLIKRLVKENYKTIYFNFKYFKFKDAIQFPVILSRNVILKRLEGCVEFNCPVKYNLVKIGFESIGIFDVKCSKSILEIKGNIIFNGKARIGQGCKISVAKNGKLIFGDQFMITAETAIVCNNNIVFGKNCLLSWDILIMDSDHHTIKNEEGEIINHSKPIIIKDKVWIGCRTLILKGTQIPYGSVIGANSVVSNFLKEEKAIYAGIPAKWVKGNITWE